MNPIKLISSVSPTEADHHRLFPKKGTVETALEGLCTVCNLGKPRQGWPRLPPKKEPDSKPLIDVEDGLKEKGMHFLGLYHYDCKPEAPVATDITLFISSCLRTAEKLGLNPHHIIEVVLIHEAAHYITHLGVKPESNPVEYWPGFGSDENKEAIEDFAQSATYFYLQASVDHAKLHCFETLSLYQQKPYTTWDRWKRQQTQGQSFWQCLGQFQKDVWEKHFSQKSPTEDDANTYMGE
jgi:hypothetical protein